MIDNKLLFTITVLFASLTLFGVQNVSALSFLGGGGSGLPRTSLDGNSTGSDTLCTCDVEPADCTADLSSSTFSISGDMVCKTSLGGEDPLTFWDNGTGNCSASFTFRDVEAVETQDTGTISLSVQAVSGKTNPNTGVVAEGTLSCNGDPNPVCPDGEGPCTLSFGGVTALKSKELETFLPETSPDGPYVLGQVLSVVYTPVADGEEVIDSNINWRLCHDRFGDFDEPGCETINVQGSKLVNTADGTLIIQSVEGDYSPASLNVTQPDNTTNGKMKLTIPCQDTADPPFDTTWIIPNRLRIGDVAPIAESIPTTCGDYTATFEREAILNSDEIGLDPGDVGTNFILQFDGYADNGEVEIRFIGRSTVEIK